MFSSRQRGATLSYVFYSLMLCASCTILTVGALTIQARARWPIQTLRNVWIVSRSDADSFKAIVQDPDTQEWNQFSFQSCKDYPITPEIAAGVTLTLLKYEERPDCMSVAKNNLGYMLRRDEHDRPLVTNDPRQTAASGRARSATQEERP